MKKRTYKQRRFKAKQNLFIYTDSSVLSDVILTGDLSFTTTINESCLDFEKVNRKLKRQQRKESFSSNPESK